MRNFILVLSLIVGSLVYAQEAHSNLNWLLDYNEAIEMSQSEHKPVLVYFTGSDWCAPCKMLKKDFFNSAEFEKRSEKMVLLMVDIPRRVDIVTPEQLKKNKELVRKYNRSGGYPNLVALNSKGKVIGELGGYTLLRETNRHFAFVDSVIENY